MNEQSIPEVGGELPVNPEAPRRLMADQVQTTDIALRAWREESERRRAAYDARLTQRQAANRAWWKRNARRTALAFSAGGVMGLAIAFVGLVTAPAPSTDRPSLREWPRPIETAAPTEPVPLPEVIVAPIARPVIVESTAPLRPAAAVSIVAGSASTWKDGGYHWVQFQVEEAEQVQIAWRDGAGIAVLEPMHCGSPGAGIRPCLAGRSHERIAHAITQGASPGSWTVEACAPAGCVPVTTFAAP